jgi:hypothetical protein
MDPSARTRPATPTRARVRTRRSRRLIAALVAIGLALGATACVGKTGRNDDHVEPGSGQQGPSGRVVPQDS